MKSIAKIAAVLLFVSSSVILQRYAVLEHISSPHSTDDGTPEKKKGSTFRFEASFLLHVEMVDR